MPCRIEDKSTLQTASTAWALFMAESFSGQGKAILSIHQRVHWTVRHREDEKTLGRLCEEEIRTALVSTGIPPEWIQTSLTHSAGCVLAIGYGGQHVLRVGVDLESAIRKVKAGIMDRVVSPQERGFKLEFLDYWVIKEACYKANPDSAGTVVSDYQIVAFDPILLRGEVRGRMGAVWPLLRFQLCRVGGWRVAFAFSQSSGNL